MADPSVDLPAGFVLDAPPADAPKPNLPSGFVLDAPAASAQSDHVLPDKVKAELRAYDPTLRDKIANYLLSLPRGPHGEETGARPSPFQERVVQGLVGSRGLGRTNPSFADVSPLAPVLGVDEMRRSQKEAYDPKTNKVNPGAALDTVLSATSAIPVVGSVSQLARAPLTQRDLLLQAAKRQDVPIPRYMASDSRSLKMTAGGAKEIPFAGEPIQKASEQTREAIGAAKDKVAEGLAPGADAQSAGRGASDAMLDWVKAKSKKEVGSEYDALDKLIKPDTAVPLSKTGVAVRGLIKSDQQSATKDGARAAALVDEALKRPGGLTWTGLKQLRTSIGDRMTGDIADEGISQKNLKLLYRALSEDMKFGVQQAAKAGVAKRDALTAFEKATASAQEAATKREQISEIIGTKGAAKPAQVFQRLMQLSGSSGQADVKRLQQVKDIVDKQVWDEVSAATIARMGLDKDGKFSPAKFTTAWSSKQISDPAKAVLFDPATKSSLDDLARLSRAWEENAKWGNPSGTGRTLAVVSGAAAFWAHPVLLALEGVSGTTAAWVLSRPVVAESAGRLMTVSSKFAAKPDAMAWEAVSRAIEDFRKVASDELQKPDVPQEIKRGATEPDGQQRLAALSQPQIAKPWAGARSFGNENIAPKQSQPNYLGGPKVAMNDDPRSEPPDGMTYLSDLESVPYQPTGGKPGEKGVTDQQLQQFHAGLKARGLSAGTLPPDRLQQELHEFIEKYGRPNSKARMNLGGPRPLPGEANDLGIKMNPEADPENYPFHNEPAALGKMGKAVGDAIMAPPRAAQRIMQNYQPGTGEFTDEMVRDALVAGPGALLPGFGQAAGDVGVAGIQILKRTDAQKLIRELHSAGKTDKEIAAALNERFAPLLDEGAEISRAQTMQQRIKGPSYKVGAMGGAGASQRITSENVQQTVSELGLEAVEKTTGEGTKYFVVRDPAVPRDPKSTYGGKTVEIRVPRADNPHSGRSKPWRIDTSIEGKRNPTHANMNVAGEPFDGNRQALLDRLAYLFGKRRPQTQARAPDEPMSRVDPRQLKLLSGGAPLPGQSDPMGSQ